MRSAYSEVGILCLCPWAASLLSAEIPCFGDPSTPDGEAKRARHRAAGSPLLWPTCYVQMWSIPVKMWSRPQNAISRWLDCRGQAKTVSSLDVSSALDELSVLLVLGKESWKKGRQGGAVPALGGNHPYRDFTPPWKEHSTLSHRIDRWQKPDWATDPGTVHRSKQPTPKSP